MDKRRRPSENVQHTRKKLKNQMNSTPNLPESSKSEESADVLYFESVIFLAEDSHPKSRVAQQQFALPKLNQLVKSVRCVIGRDKTMHENSAKKLREQSDNAEDLRIMLRLERMVATDAAKQQEEKNWLRKNHPRLLDYLEWWIANKMEVPGGAQSKIDEFHYNNDDAIRAADDVAETAVNELEILQSEIHHLQTSVEQAVKKIKTKRKDRE